MSSHKNLFATLLTALCVHLLAACADARDAATDGSNNRLGAAPHVREPVADDRATLDLGQDWFSSRRAPGRTTTDGSDPASPAPDRSTAWTIILRTFTPPDDEIAAANMVRSCAAIDSRLAAARVHATSKGSMVVYGLYDASDAPQAQRDLDWIKNIRIQGRQVFPGAWLSRINLRHASRQFKPNELLAVRQKYPDVDPLYTLQVAAWGDFASGEIPLDEIRRRAEAYARELRTRGYTAYFHHDDDQHLSIVTVGLFDYTAIDPQSGLFSPEVERLLGEFPQHLVNGEPFHEPVNPNFPSLGTQIQRPTLVLVPTL